MDSWRRTGCGRTLRFRGNVTAPFVLAALMLVLGLLSDAVLGQASPSSPACPTPWNTTTESPTVTALFLGVGADPVPTTLPSTLPCVAALCRCWGTQTGIAPPSDGCTADLPPSVTCRAPAPCMSDFLRCRLRATANTNLRMAVLQAAATPEAMRNSTDLARGCRFAACYISQSVAASCPLDAASVCAPVLAYALRTATRTRTPPLETATTPTTPSPIATITVPPATPNSFTFLAPVPVTRQQRDALAAVLTNFATTQTSSVLPDPTTAPRQITVSVTVQPLNTAGQWLATVAVVAIGGTATAAELEMRLAQRLDDAVADTPAKPTAFTTAGIVGNHAVLRPIPVFPNIADSLISSDEGSVPLWGLALAVLLAVGFGVLLGALLARTVCRVRDGASLRDRLALDEPRRGPAESPYVSVR